MHLFQSTKLRLYQSRAGVLIRGCLLLFLLGSLVFLVACADGSGGTPAGKAPGAQSPGPTRTNTNTPTATATAGRPPTFTPNALGRAEGTATAQAQEARMASTIAAEMLTAAAQAQTTATAAQFGTIAVDYGAQATATEEAQKLAKLITVQAEPAFSGPLAGYLETAQGQKSAPGSADVNLRNFVTKTRFAFRPLGDLSLDPPLADAQPAGITLQFREGSDGYTALVLYEDARWELAVYDGQAITSKQEGQLLELAPEGWNELALYVDELRGYFFLNGRLVSQLLLDDTLHSGDIALAMGLPTSSESTGVGIDYEAFTIWAMEPILPLPTPTPTLTPYPTITPATPRPPEGMGRVFLINETTDRPLSVDLPQCPGYIGSVAAGESIECLMPEGSYEWRAWGWSCQQFLPRLELTSDTLVVLRILRAERDCDYDLSLCVGDDCEIFEPTRMR